jgi:antitoxin (DNA-binding transcriptional repressor) of toxin-antitoxin stability system
MIENMKLHIAEAEFALDIHVVLEKVRQGAEVVIERDGRPVAEITRPEPPISS